jgi:hypothetical protein
VVDQPRGPTAAAVPHAMAGEPSVSVGVTDVELGSRESTTPLLLPPARGPGVDAGEEQHSGGLQLGLGVETAATGQGGHGVETAAAPASSQQGIAWKSSLERSPVSAASCSGSRMSPTATTNSSGQGSRVWNRPVGSCEGLHVDTSRTSGLAAAVSPSRGPLVSQALAALQGKLVTHIQQ